MSFGGILGRSDSITDRNEYVRLYWPKRTGNIKGRACPVERQDAGGTGWKIRNLETQNPKQIKIQKAEITKRFMCRPVGANFSYQ